MTLPTIVAHEGNPRTDSLTVAGTLDGTPTIVPPTTGPDPSVEPPQSGPSASPKPTASNPDKYTLTTFIYGTDVNDNQGTVQQTNSALVDAFPFAPCAGTVFEYSNHLGRNMWGAVISPTVLTNFYLYDRARSVTVATAIKFYHYDFYDMLNTDWTLYGKWSSNANISYTQQRGLAFISANATGNPFSGVAAGVHPDSTYDDFTGLVQAFDWATNIEYMMSYNHQSLSNFGTILASEDQGTPYVANDFLYLTIYQGTGVGGAGTSWASSSKLTSAPSGFTPPYIGPDMRTALVNLPPTVPAGTEDSITWSNVNGILFIQ